jgi:hypothetical protein
MKALLHVSENGSIKLFEPRRYQALAGIMDEKVVWAVDEERLPNYLLPRDCPRVTFYPGPDSHSEDVRSLFGPTAAARVVAIEATWFERALNTKLFIYEFPPEGFRLLDSGAGYYVSGRSVVSIDVREVESPAIELLRRNVELRVVPSLWPLRDAVAGSTLQFSFIRLRNASPRPV